MIKLKTKYFSNVTANRKKQTRTMYSKKLEIFVVTHLYKYEFSGKKEKIKSHIGAKE